MDSLPELKSLVLLLERYRRAVADMLSDFSDEELSAHYLQRDGGGTIVTDSEHNGQSRRMRKFRKYFEPIEPERYAAIQKQLDEDLERKEQAAPLIGKSVRAADKKTRNPTRKSAQDHR